MPRTFLTNKEKKRKDTKKQENVKFSEIDLTYIDGEVANFFVSKNLTVKDEVDGVLREIPVGISTAERWRILREGSGQKRKGTFSTEATLQSVTPLITIVRNDIERDVGKFGDDFFKVRLATEPSVKNQYLSKNIDEYLRKKYKPQYKYIITMTPLSVTINYTAYLYASKKFHFNKMIEFILSLDDIISIKTDRGVIHLHFEDIVSDSSNIEDFTDEQRKFEGTMPFKAITQLMPEFGIDKLPALENILSPITITTEETIIKP